MQRRFRLRDHGVLESAVTSPLDRIVISSGESLTHHIFRREILQFDDRFYGVVLRWQLLYRLKEVLGLRFGYALHLKILLMSRFQLQRPLQSFLFEKLRSFKVNFVLKRRSWSRKITC